MTDGRRLLLVTGEFPPQEGGVGAYTRELARALAAAGHQVHVFTGREARPASAGNSWRTLREAVDLGYAQLHPRARRWRWWDVGQIVDVVGRYEIEVVNLQYQAAAYNMRHPAINLAPWRLRGLVPTVVTFHDLRVPYLFPRAGRLRNLAIGFMAQQAAGVVVTNRADEEDLRRRVDTPLVSIPIGSNIAAGTWEAGEVAAAREALGVPPGALLLGYFGFLHPSKGADVLVEALALVADAHLVFIGGATGDSDAGTNRAFLATLEARVAELGLRERVHWTGFRPDDEVSAFLHAVDVMAMPYRDGASLRRGTLMAALAHGRPLVTTKPEAPTPELVHGENAWLVPRGDAQGLADAILHLAADAALAERLGRGARSLSDQFAWDRIAARVSSFQEFILASWGRRG